MGNVTGFKWNMRGVEEVFRSSGVVSDERSRMQRVCDKANELVEELYPNNGYAMPHFVLQQYRTTHGNVGYNVHANTDLAKHAQAKHSVLTRAMDAGRS